MKGFYPKYIVIKVDGNDNEWRLDAEPLTDVFVLRPEKDRAALVALQAYADATTNEVLADDLYVWISHIEDGAGNGDGE